MLENLKKEVYEANMELVKRGLVKIGRASCRERVSLRV